MVNFYLLVPLDEAITTTVDISIIIIVVIIIITTTTLCKVACRVQIWKKTFCQNSDKFGYSFIKNDIMFMHGAIIRTGITCKKILCYMRDPACRWFIVKKVKIF